MKLVKLDYDLTICKIDSVRCLNFNDNQDPANNNHPADNRCSADNFFVLAKTDEEISLVCQTCDVPLNTLAREDGWKAFRIQGILDFSLVGILSKITTILAEHQIGVFAVSTFNTDYVLVKAEQFDLPLSILKENGYELC